MPLTSRDKKFYDYLTETRLPILSTDCARLFYPSETGNERSSIVIAQRRAKVMEKEQYIQISKKGFGGSVYYYVGQPPSSKMLRHSLMKSSAIAKIATSGFEIISIDVEHHFPEKYSLISDLYLTCKYGKETFDLIVEVDLSKDFNVEGYTRLIKDIKNNNFQLKRPLYILSVCDFKIKDEFIKMHVTQIKTDFSDFEKFKYNFIR